MIHPYAYCLDRAAQLSPDATAVVEFETGRRVSWRELAVGAAAVAEGLRAAGVKLDSRVAVIQSNSIAYLEAIIGVAYTGAAFVPVAGSAHEHELAYIVDHAAPQLTLDVSDGQPVDVRGDWRRWQQVDGHPDSLAQILYTSGSTGSPKGIMHSYRSTLSAMSNWTFVAGVGLGEPHRALAVTPVSHASGRLFEAVLMGAGSIVLSSTTTPSAIRQAIAQYAITHTFLVPTLLRRLVDSDTVGPEDFRSIRRLRYGAAPTAESLIRDAYAMFGSTLQQGWGSTEVPASNTVLTGQMHTMAIDGGEPQLLRSCGSDVSTAAQLRIVDEGGHPVSEGEIGTLEVRAPWAAVGYWGDARGWQDRHHEGWLDSGDLARRMAGYIYLEGRSGDEVITGGYNVAPQQIENALSSHPLVREVVVVGIPDAEWGERLVAAVVSSGTVTHEDLRAHCKARLSGFKVPKEFRFFDALPVSRHGKVSRSSVRALFLDESQQPDVTGSAT